MTRKEVDSEEYKVVYEVDYLFLEEGQRQHSYDEIDDVDLKRKDKTEASSQEQKYNNSL